MKLTVNKGQAQDPAYVSIFGAYTNTNRFSITLAELTPEQAGIVEDFLATIGNDVTTIISNLDSDINEVNIILLIASDTEIRELDYLELSEEDKNNVNAFVSFIDSLA